MGSLRVIVFNVDESFAPSLRSTLMGFEAVHIVADVNDAALLAHVIQEFPAEILVAHIDPNPEAMLALIGDVVAAHPDLAAFAVSESTDGKLILSAMRLGFREFLTKPIDAGVLGDALTKITKRTEEGDKTGKVIAVVGTGGGVGASSLAVNIAVELVSLASRKISVVDLDYRFGQVATMLDLTPTYTIADLAQSPERLERQVVERALVEHSSGVHVLSRPPHFVQCENITAASCVGVISAMALMNDYVVVDGPNRYDVGASAILDLADTTLLVVQLLVPSVRNAQRILQGMGEAGFNLERTRLVVNRTGRYSGPLRLSDVEATLGRKIDAEIPDDWTTMSGSINLGEPLATYGPKTKLRIAIRDLAKRIHAPDEQADDDTETAKKSGRLLSKLFSDG